MYIIGCWRSVCVVACGMRVSVCAVYVCSRESVVDKTAIRVWECVVGKATVRVRWARQQQMTMCCLMLWPTNHTKQLYVCSRESVVGKAAMRVWECVVGKTVPYESKTNGGKGWKDISVRIQYFVSFSQVCAHYWMRKKWLERKPSKYICTINNVKKRSTRWFHMSPKQMGGKAGKT